MDEIMNLKTRNKLIKRFRKVAKADVLTNEDGLAIVNILEEACRRASVDLKERMLRGLIEGDGSARGSAE